MALKWRKRGALKAGIEIRRKIEGKLHSWDFLPIGKKIANIEALLSAARKPVGARGEFWFLRLAKEMELEKTGKLLEERLAGERKSLEDMKSVFSHWQIDLGKIGLKPEDISHPHKTRWWTCRGRNLMMFTSPGMAKWYEENVEKKRMQPSLQKPEQDTMKIVGKKKVFGFGRVWLYRGGRCLGSIPPLHGIDVIGRALYRLRPPDAEISLVQPIVFYKRTWEQKGKPNTARTLPLANPDMLLLYAQLKEAKKIGARTVRVEGKYADVPYSFIYDRIAKLSPPFGPEEAEVHTSTRAVFRRRA